VRELHVRSIVAEQKIVTAALVKNFRVCDVSADRADHNIVSPIINWLPANRRSAQDDNGESHITAHERQIMRRALALARLIESLCNRLTAENYDDAVQLAALSDVIRGYENVKLGNVERYVTAVQMHCAKLSIAASLCDLLAGSTPGPPVRHTPRRTASTLYRQAAT
jgi:hypothetical protein